MWVTIEKPGWPRKSSGSAASNRRSPRRNEAAPETKIGKGPKGKVKTKGKTAKVRFTFSSPTAGAKFECALVKLPKGRARSAPKPKFKGCKSPKKLTLKPGKYRFSVRAVSGGVADPSPATRPSASSTSAEPARADAPRVQRLGPTSSMRYSSGSRTKAIRWPSVRPPGR